MRLRERLMCGWAAVLLAACAATTAPDAPGETQKPDEFRDYARDFVGDLVKVKLRQNGEYMFCDQRAGPRNSDSRISDSLAP